VGRIVSCEALSATTMTAAHNFSAHDTPVESTDVAIAFCAGRPGGAPRACKSARVSCVDSLDAPDAMDDRFAVDSAQTCFMDVPTRNGRPII
jgi:hypothetical protein